jgi:hypothetical protein
MSSYCSLAFLKYGLQDSLVALGRLYQLIDLNVFVDGVRQVFPGWAKANGLDVGFAGVVAAIGAEGVLGDLWIKTGAS